MAWHVRSDVWSVVLMLCLCRDLESHHGEAQTRYMTKLRHSQTASCRTARLLLRCLSPSCYPRPLNVNGAPSYFQHTTQHVTRLRIRVSTSAAQCRCRKLQARKHGISTILNCVHMKMLVNSTAQTKHQMQTRAQALLTVLIQKVVVLCDLSKQPLTSKGVQGKESPSYSSQLASH